MSKSKEVVKKEETLPAEMMGTWGAEEGIDQEDLLIPKLLLMQGLSEFVTEEKAQPGEICRSTTGEVVAKRGEAVRIVPIKSFKTWIVEEKVGNKYEYRGVEPFTPANKLAPLEYEKDGGEWRRNKALNFYVLVADDVERESKGEVAAIPAIISFRRTSYNAGRKLYSGIAESIALGQPPASKAYDLYGKKVTNDLGTFYVFDIGEHYRADMAAIKKAYQWHESLKAGEAKTHDVEG